MLEEPSSRPPSQSPFWVRHLSRQLQFLLDLTVLVGAFALAYLLRFDFQIPSSVLEQAFIQLPFVVLVQFAALFLAGIYAFIWRYVGMGEVQAFVRAALLSATPILALRLGLPEQFRDWRVPLSVIFVDTVFAFGGVLALRVLRRSLYERFERRRTDNGTGSGTRVLLVGAGRAGVMVAKEIQGRGDTGLQIAGFVDDDAEKLGSRVQGVRVLGTTRDLPLLCREGAIDRVIICIVEASRQQVRRIVEICERASIRAQIIPGLYEIVGGQVEINRIRDIEIEDLLGRQPVRLDEAALRSFLTGKRVMVTGAGGSIGSELVRQAARFDPASLELVERAEFALFQIDREIERLWPDLRHTALLADVGDESRMRQVISETRPQIILHAAAHKHVPLMETNASEAIRNNVLASRLLAELAGEYEVETFVLISTDKAVRPTSVMGASKRLAELVILDLDRRSSTRFLGVRFGNVLGSTGSVIPIFREQIAAGGPVTVTHPDMVRYFMTIPEASQLVLQAGAIGRGGEIFVLDMGEPVRILDLAKDMIALSGLRPYEDIDIVITGPRRGEKLYEELELLGEDLEKTRHPKIFIGRLAGPDRECLEAGLTELDELARFGLQDEIRAALSRLVPEACLTAAAVDEVRSHSDGPPPKPAALG